LRVTSRGLGDVYKRQTINALLLLSFLRMKYITINVIIMKNIITKAIALELVFVLVLCIDGEIGFICCCCMGIVIITLFSEAVDFFNDFPRGIYNIIIIKKILL
jgi:hypothetical protein